MPFYPHTKISRWSDARENGSPTYAVWRCLTADNTSVKGFITKTTRGTWQLDLATPFYGQRITEVRKLADAKVMARELLA
jgi:hypothetical protein